MGKEQSGDNRSKPDTSKTHSPTKEVPVDIRQNYNDGKPTKGTPVPPRPPSSEGKNEEK